MRIFISVCLFEGGLGVVAWILGWLSGLERPERSPGENLMRMKWGFEEAPL